MPPASVVHSNAAGRFSGWIRRAGWTWTRCRRLSPERARELCALDDALERLAAQDPRRAQVIELRFFGGLSVEETAEALDVSPQTVMRDWRLARAWLAVELQRPTI